MNSVVDLERFVTAQQTSYERALAEIKNGRKESHWMWYIFPQIQGLGFSETARRYAIINLKEAEAFLTHPVLGERLIRISNELLKIKSNNALEVFGSPDHLKLKSSMTLFAHLNMNPVFNAVLDKFFKGETDERTLSIIQGAGD